MALVSPCCGAEVREMWKLPSALFPSGTYYWECVACKKPCDPVEKPDAPASA